MSGEWYAGGLRFACTRCGNCCTGEPGSVRISPEEIAALATHLQLKIREVRARFTYKLDDGAISLRETADHDCIFWNRERGCTIYAHRPRQCRTWPFWRANLASPGHWARAAEHCPGMDTGPAHPAAQIRRTAATDGTSGVIPV